MDRRLMKLPKFTRVVFGALASSGVVAMMVTAAQAFPWSIDMYRGPQVSTFTEPPREMPDGVLPIDGTHYNVHYGQPDGMPDQPALPPMKLEVMTVRMRNPLSATPDNLAKGKERFETNCSPCHGMTGEGNGTVVHLLQHKPANLLTGVSKNLPDGYIYGYIRNGGVWMPSYDEAMSSTERWQTVLYVRDLERRYSGQPAVAAAPAESGPHRSATDVETDYTEQGSDSP
jgi:mono/diheme cytochrome c family protein